MLVLISDAMVTTKSWQLVEWKKNKAEWLKEHNKCIWCGATEKIIPHHPNRDEGKETYISLKTAVPMCTKCHLNLHKGRILCNTCRKHYHKKKWVQCWHCLKEKNPDFKTQAQKEAEELAEFENEETERDEASFNRWICKDCRFIKLCDEADTLSGAYQNASCSNPKKISAEIKNLEKNLLEKKGIKTRIKKEINELKESKTTRPVFVPGYDEEIHDEEQVCEYKEISTEQPNKEI
jgi:hypothetical protein